ncbi:hypothetical protein D9758_016223 [Tetrapyrgos nigripes]|uniref:Uncharacterized protein n=1 Tax=Tetrapyrgos nigripes TaxID=182062 RepID=A0A8H5CLR8_9AGAR|nr:hypothetical protein D9758_016223 [Tetrapyrgos nigripes]
MHTQNVPIEDLIQYIDRMKKRARQTRKSANAVADAFKEVNRGVSRLIDTYLPRQIASAEDEGRRAAISGRRHRRATRIAGYIIEHLPDLGTEITVATTLSAQFSPNLPIIILPIAFAGTAFLVKCTATVVRDTCSKIAEERQVKEKSVIQIISELNAIAGTLAALRGSVVDFVRWWDSEVNELTLLKKAISKQESIGDSKWTNVFGKWKEIGRCYQEYNHEVRMDPFDVTRRSLLKDFAGKINILRSWYPDECNDKLLPYAKSARLQ